MSSMIKTEKEFSTCSTKKVLFQDFLVIFQRTIKFPNSPSPSKHFSCPFFPQGWSNSSLAFFYWTTYLYKFFWNTVSDTKINQVEKTVENLRRTIRFLLEKLDEEWDDFGSFNSETKNWRLIDFFSRSETLYFINFAKIDVL